MSLEECIIKIVNDALKPRLRPLELCRQFQFCSSNAISFFKSGHYDIRSRIFLTAFKELVNLTFAIKNGTTVRAVGVEYIVLLHNPFFRKKIT